MTFKEIQKLIHHRQSESNLDQTRFFNRLKDKPFWIWNVEQHKAEDIRTKGDCCFNHIIGLPIKGGKERPIYDYQKIIYDALDKYKHVFIKKSTGLGISEFFLRYICWLSLKDNTLQDSQVCIITGPRIELAITLIERMKRLFEPFPAEPLIMTLLLSQHKVIEWLAKQISKHESLANNISKEVKQSKEELGKENTNEYIRKNKRIHYIDNDDY